MFGVGEFFADAFGISGSRYQWVINAAERQAFEVTPLSEARTSCRRRD
jgi:hypothetical protein